MTFSTSELIINPDGSIYHLGLKPEELAHTILLVGDPGRVELVSAHFDKIHYRAQHREFISVSGELKGVALTVVSTGIGTDNIDIVVNELDALANIDFTTRTIKPHHTSLELIRLGTSGSVQEDIKPGSLVMSEFALGFDNLMHFYADSNTFRNEDFEQAFMKHLHWDSEHSTPYLVRSSEKLAAWFSEISEAGITISSPGFYAPQGRELRLKPFYQDLAKRISSFRYDEKRVTNFEMEGSAIYGLARLLNHEAITICTIIANRISMDFDQNSALSIQKMIKLSLDLIVNKKKSKV